MYVRSCMFVVRKTAKFLILKGLEYGYRKWVLICKSNGFYVRSLLLARNFSGPSSGGAVLRINLVDVRCRVQYPVALVDLAIWSFPWFSPKFV